MRGMVAKLYYMDKFYYYKEYQHIVVSMGTDKGIGYMAVAYIGRYCRGRNKNNLNLQHKQED